MSPFDVPHKLTWEQIWLAYSRMRERVAESRVANAAPDKPGRRYMPLSAYIASLGVKPKE